MVEDLKIGIICSTEQLQVATKSINIFQEKFVTINKTIDESTKKWNKWTSGITLLGLYIRPSTNLLYHHW